MSSIGSSTNLDTTGRKQCSMEDIGTMPSIGFFGMSAALVRCRILPIKTNVISLPVHNKCKSFLMVCASILSISNLTFHRWDALLRGPMRPIDRNRIPMEFRGPSLFSFHERDPAIRNRDSEIDSLQFQFKQQAKSIRLALRSGYSSSYTGAVRDSTHFYGMTDRNTITGEAIVTIHIAIEELQPLMTGDLNPDET